MVPTRHRVDRGKALPPKMRSFFSFSLTCFLLPVCPIQTRRYFGVFPRQDPAAVYKYSLSAVRTQRMMSDIRGSPPPHSFSSTVTLHCMLVLGCIILVWTCCSLFSLFLLSSSPSLSLFLLSSSPSFSLFLLSSCPSISLFILSSSPSFSLFLLSSYPSFSAMCHCCRV